MEDSAVISVAYFHDDPKVRDAVLLSDRIREETLKRCFAIPGFELLVIASHRDKEARKEGNRIYDSVCAQVTAEFQKEA